MFNPIHHHLNQNLFVVSMMLDNLADLSYSPTKVVKHKQADFKDLFSNYFWQFINNLIIDRLDHLL